jgi:transposase
MRTMLKNRVHALMHRRGILTPTVDLFVGAGRKFLEQQRLDQAGQDILGRFRTLIDQFDRSIAESTASLRELQRQPRWARPAALLQTIPGIGLITALTILAELGDLSRFRCRAAVANYAGLVPRHRDSDEKRWSGHITRQGPSHLRAVLAEAAWVSVKRVPVYKALFGRVAYKRGKQRAIIAVARRMLEDGWTLLRKNEPFRYVPTPTPAGAGRRDSLRGQPWAPLMAVEGSQTAPSVAG